MDQIDSTQSQVKSNYTILFWPIIASFVVVVVRIAFQTWVEHVHRWLIAPYPVGAMKLGMSGVGLLAALRLAAVILNQHDEAFGLSAELGICLATLCAMTVAIIVAKWFARWDPLPSQVIVSSSAYGAPGGEATTQADLLLPSPFARNVAMVAVIALVAGIPYRLTVAYRQGQLALNHAGFTAAVAWLVPLLLCAFALFGYFRGVKVYEVLTEGAKEGFQVAVRIIPYMAAIFVGIAMLRASGALDAFVWAVSPLTTLVGMPAEALPMVFLRPLSGSGAFAFMSEATKRDPNGFLAYLLAVMQGSTETTFYVLAVYFGAVGVRSVRYAVTVGLIADAIGFAAALFFSRLMY